MNKLRVAVTLMPTKLAEVDKNMETAEEYIKNAVHEKAKLIVFPEFFTTGFAFTSKIYDAIADSVSIELRLQELSKKYQIAIGGSYLWYDAVKDNTYNRFGLFFPSGETYFHCKDIPTGIENFCYTSGDQNRIFDTPLGKIGIVMCWEQLRCDTYRQIAGNVDFVIGGSCWWGFAPEDGERLYRALEEKNRRLADRMPSYLAHKLHVPFVHASHHASFEGGTLTNSNKLCKRTIHGDASIIDRNGKSIIKAEGNAGVYIADIETAKQKKTIWIPAKKYWIVHMPHFLKKGFYMLNDRYEPYYQKYGRKEIKNRIDKE